LPASKPSSGPTTSSSTAGASPDTASSAATPGRTVPSAALLKITVQRSEVPAGYQSKPHQADPTSGATQAALVGCIGGTDTTKDKTGEAHSPEYVLQRTQISSGAESFRSKKDVDADIALIRSPKASSCYQKSFIAKLTAALPSSATIKTVAFKINPHPTGQPSNVVGTGTGTITVQTSRGTLDFHLGIAFITGGLIESEVDIFTVGAPVPAALLSTLTKKVAGRTTTQ